MAFSFILENYIRFSSLKANQMTFKWRSPFKKIFHNPTNTLKICSKIHVQIKISSYSTVNFFAHYNTMYGIGLYEKTALCCLFYIILLVNVMCVLR